MGEAERQIIEVMVDAEVQSPQPNEDECQRYFDANPSRFVVGQALHRRRILFAVTPCVNVQALTVHAEKALLELTRNDASLLRLRCFKSDYFPLHQQRFQDLMSQGQHPKTLFIGSPDLRLVPYLLTGNGPGELFIVRNVAAFIPPYGGSHGLHSTTAAINTPR
ncbi:Carbonic anhydrase [Polaromonas sp. CG9_12]|nr:Carbonic anhydrase [Polaromonas sp. CG9_12]